MNFKGRFAIVLGLIVLVMTLSNACSSISQNPLTATVYPNLEQARTEGFSLLAGHPPFKVGFHAEVGGGNGMYSYEWDLDGDGASDSTEPDPERTYTQPGEYTASVSVSDTQGQEALTEQRIVVIGEPKWPDWRFGVASHLDRAEGDTEAEREARMIAEAGIEAVRLDLAWTKVQPNSRDDYEWGKYDSLIALSQRYGFSLLPMIAYSSEWASTAGDTAVGEDRTHAPPSPTEYAWFAYNAADRYKADIRAWEVWNEPNLSRFWRPEPDPALYTELLKQAYLAIKYADPEAVVVLGGLTDDESGQASWRFLYPPEEFLQVVYDEGGASYFDVVGSHPYTNPAAGVEFLIRKLDALRTVMTNDGDGEKPIWLTEYGTPTSPKEEVSNEVQGAWLTQSLDALSSTNQASVVFWYDFRDDGSDPNDPEHNFGLVEQDFEIKPAYRAYVDYIRESP